MNTQYFKTALKKAEFGENIMRRFFEKEGWIVYQPVTEDKPHYFDMFITKNKSEARALDVKTKARLNNWPAQGIDIAQYNQYYKFYSEHIMPFYLFFVDDKNGDIHFANFKELVKAPSFNPTPKIIAWSLSDMHYLFNIGKENIRILATFDQRNHAYLPSGTGGVNMDVIDGGKETL